MHPVPQRASTSHLDRLIGREDRKKKKDNEVLTWAVETLASSDIKNDPSDGEQDPPAVMPIELCEGARGICGEA